MSVIKTLKPNFLNFKSQKNKLQKKSKCPNKQNSFNEKCKTKQ